MLSCKSTGHVSVAPTSQKLLATQLEEHMDGAEVVDGFGWALLKQICGFSAPPLKNAALGTAEVSWDCPLHTPMVSALLSSSGSALYTQIQLHTMPQLHHTEHLALIAFNTHWFSSQPRTSQMVGPLMLHLSPWLTPAPDALGAEVPSVFSIKADFSDNKYISQSRADEHPNIFVLTFSTLYKKEER